MARTKSKQSLLSMSTFLKKASASTLTKHKRLENGMNPNAVVRKTPWVDKKRTERLARELVERDGIKRWRSYLENSGVEDVERFDLDLLHKVHGKPTIKNYQSGIDDDSD
jgi:hypothetical protein